MAAKNSKGLGKGLDALFGEAQVAPAEKAPAKKNKSSVKTADNDEPRVGDGGVLYVDINDIKPNSSQPRKSFDEEKLDELATSIERHGLIQPIVLRKLGKGYEIVAGERRWRAARIVGLKEVPCIVKELTDEENMLLAIIENMQREDLNPIEEAAAYESLVKKLGYTQEKLAERVGKSREYCANMMRLLKLPSEVQQLVIEKKLTNGHVRPLLSLEDDGAIYDAAMKIVHDKMSVREVEKYVHELNGTEKKAVKPEKKKDPMIRDIENRMSSKLGTQVEINSKKITISFSDTDDLNRILEELGCLEEGY